MNRIETKSQAGQAKPIPEGSIAEVRTELTGFLREIKGFQGEIESRLERQQEHLTMLDRKIATRHRPVLSAASAETAPHRKAFGAYLRSGDDDALRAVLFEEKALSSAVAADGGYLVDPLTAEQIQSVLRSAASIRSVANVVNVEATSFDVLVDHTDIGVGWATEAGPTAETETPQIERISIPLHELSAMPKASQRLLDDSAFDIGEWLAARIADRFARAEAAAFITGDGVDKPTGVLSYPTVGNDGWSWGSIGYVATGNDGAFAIADASDAIVNLVYSLGARYRANASFVMNSATAGTVRKMKDADGRFLWSDGLAAAELARLMGYPVLICEDMPDIASDADAILFGDFKAGYTIAERLDLRILRDPFSAKPHVLFYATKRVGGDVTDFAAIKTLKFAVS